MKDGEFKVHVYIDSIDPKNYGKNYCLEVTEDLQNWTEVYNHGISDEFGGGSFDYPYDPESQIESSSFTRTNVGKTSLTNPGMKIYRLREKPLAEIKKTN
jgi:hypothetical protein